MCRISMKSLNRVCEANHIAECPFQIPAGTVEPCYKKAASNTKIFLLHIRYSLYAYICYTLISATQILDLLRYIL